MLWAALANTRVKPAAGTAGRFQVTRRNVAGRGLAGTFGGRVMKPNMAPNADSEEAAAGLLPGNTRI